MPPHSSPTHNGLKDDVGSNSKDLNAPYRRNHFWGLVKIEEDEMILDEQFQQKYSPDVSPFFLL